MIGKAKEGTLPVGKAGGDQGIFIWKKMGGV